MKSIPQSAENFKLDIDKLVKEFRELCQTRWEDPWLTESAGAELCGSGTTLMQNLMSPGHELEVTPNFCESWFCPRCSVYKASRLFEHLLRIFAREYGNGRRIYYSHVDVRDRHELGRIRDDIRKRASRTSPRADFLLVHRQEGLEIFASSALPGYNAPKVLAPLEPNKLVESLKQALAVPFGRFNMVRARPLTISKRWRLPQGPRYRRRLGNADINAILTALEHHGIALNSPIEDEDWQKKGYEIYEEAIRLQKTWKEDMVDLTDEELQELEELLEEYHSWNGRN